MDGQIPEAVAERLRQGREAFAADQQELALACFREVLAQVPDQEEALYFCGDLARRQGRWQEAMSLFHALVERRPAHPGYRFQRAQCALSLGQMQDAARDFKYAAELKPDWHAPLLRWAMALLGLGQAADAETVLTGYLVLEPKDAQGHFQLAMAHLLQDRAAPAGVAAARAMALDATLVESVFQLALSLVAEGRMEGAVALLVALLRCVPDHEAAHRNLSRLLILMGGWDEAARHLHWLRTQGRAAADDLLAEARLMVRDDHADAAQELLREGMARFPNHGGLRAEWGRMLLARGEGSAGQSALLESLALDPGQGQAHWLLADLGAGVLWSASRIGDMDRLARSQQRSWRDRALIRYALGRVLEEQGNWQAAFRQYQTAQRIHYVQQPYNLTALRELVEHTLTGGWLHRTAMNASASRPVHPPMLFVAAAPRAGAALVVEHLRRQGLIPRADPRGKLARMARLLSKSLPSGQNLMDAVGQLSPETRARLAADYLAGRDTGLIVDCHHENLLYLGLVAALFPQARVLWVERNPLERAIACLTQPFLCLDPALAFAADPGTTLRHAQHVARLSAHYHDYLPLQMLTVTYEELTHQAPVLCARVAAFLGSEAHGSETSTGYYYGDHPLWARGQPEAQQALRSGRFPVWSEGVLRPLALLRPWVEAAVTS
ncbi:MAG: tetratricopeptide repeat protein [Magnetococcus sp. WYHC-3]